ncbi:High-affnity carbon uptake protein Hat/HatR [Rhodococcus wratislaviensis]|uniref:High-affnity carbon uptake protein Hat/HatR n=1 Tax=Rhodococcus wratislaviensis TaxID=44752 RepID=A0A402CHA2_RHOWR|nr:caspase family protein [Rhodococcus wratislaviensis]GCE42955.1 High-affnity carbon uptake protein Hat/HatR [Rhodococcus wratislaviensis]
MKRALLVGIDHYPDFGDLAGCVNDARALAPLLSRNEDDSPNFACRTELASDDASAVTRDDLLRHLDELLAPGPDCALFYFAGHGEPVSGEVALVTSDGTTNTPGVRFVEVLEKIKSSTISEVIVILDCCFSGGASVVPLAGGNNMLPDGLSILTASRGDQSAIETASGRGQFSVYLEGALDGGAADVLGHVNVSGLFAYLSESFGAWDQRPTFKANIDRLHDVRMCDPRLPLPTLRNLTKWFVDPNMTMPLDPSFEPEEKLGNAENEEIFAGLQKLRANRLIEPVGEDHLYFAAINSTGCELTPLGKHYWELVRAGRI